MKGHTMTIMIETAAYKAILFGTLSCKCPVTQETEAAFFEEYFRMSDSQSTEFARIKSIADNNPENTPVHNLLEIASYGHDDPTSFTITTGDVLRALGSQFHFKNMVGNLSHMIVRDVPSFLVSHMLVPARLVVFAETVRAIYPSPSGEIFFDNIFVPPDIEWNEDDTYAVHMGTVICTLLPSQVENLHAHLGMISDFENLCSQCDRVDFKDFQFYGDYYHQVQERFQRYFKK